MKRGPAIGIGIGIGVVIVALVSISGWESINENSITSGDQSELENTDDLETTEGKNFRITLEDGIGAGDLP